MFYGDRSGGVKGPSGNSWFIATHKEDVAPQELAKRAEAFLTQTEDAGLISIATQENPISRRRAPSGLQRNPALAQRSGELALSAIA